MSGKQGHKCVLCNANLESKEALQEHFRRHANNEIDKAGRVEPIVASADCICDMCGKIFESSTDTIKHRFKVHPESSKYYCCYCGKQFPLKIHRDKHIISHDEDENNEAEHRKCGECGFVFYNSVALSFHMSSAHLESKTLRKFERRKEITPPKREHKCVLCEAKLDSKEALREHFRKHANNEIDNNGRMKKVVPKPKAEFECDVCDKLFTSITETIRHRFKMHPDSPKFYCCFCGKQFPLKIHRDKHMETHDPHEANIEPHKKCLECDGLFYNEKAFDFHHRSVHKRIVQMLQPIPTPPPSNKIKVNSMNDALSVYYCHLCGVEYVIKFNLQQHLERVHTQAERDAVPEDLIKCTMCSALFCSKRAYETHNSYHKPNDLYVTSEQQRLQTVTKVDQDFDIRRVTAEKFPPRVNESKRRATQQCRHSGTKRPRDSVQVKVEVDFPFSDQEAYDYATRSSDSESDMPLNRRMASS
ncbi:gastrula zinc finger protein XlCGF26.1-like [Venturia canescens]|uniref:gastrula zinc finger protein XlCGF26.1-like n=1 Tax=Venturia canescens TaxID=32260 RepID=UPI001C9CFCB7|nr:gastrula zinc finger protein XlCGF26.1-like [Venturia canescens]